jgi:hypothetical protein
VEDAVDAVSAELANDGKSAAFRERLDRRADVADVGTVAHLRDAYVEAFPRGFGDALRIRGNLRAPRSRSPTCLRASRRVSA